MIESMNITATEETHFPAGGGVPTVSDIYRFTEMLRRGGELDGFRLLSPAIVRLAATNQTGSAPIASILLTMNMACTLFRLTPEEALAGATRNAARALGLGDCGMIAPGLRADLAIWDVGHPAELAYRIGFNPLSERLIGGQS